MEKETDLQTVRVRHVQNRGKWKEGERRGGWEKEGKTRRTNNDPPERETDKGG